MPHPYRTGTRAPDEPRRAALLVCLAAASCTSGPGRPDERPYQQQVLAFRADKDQFFRTGKDSPIPAERARRLSRARLLRGRCRPRACRRSSRRNGRRPPVIIELQTSGDELRRMRKVGTLGFSFAGGHVQAHGVCRRRGRERRPALRAVRRSQQRVGDLSRRPVPGARPHADRTLRSRLQSRLSPVLRLQPHLHLSGAAGREPPPRRDPRRRTARK